MTNASGKIECLNPNTGRKLNIDKEINDLFRHTIYDVLRQSQMGTSFTELANGMKKCFTERKIALKEPSTGVQ